MVPVSQMVHLTLSYYYTQIICQCHKPHRQIIHLDCFSPMIISLLLLILIFFLIFMILFHLHLGLVLAQHLCHHSSDLRERCPRIPRQRPSQQGQHRLHPILQFFTLYELQKDLLGDHAWVRRVSRRFHLFYLYQLSMNYECQFFIAITSKNLMSFSFKRLYLGL